MSEYKQWWRSKTLWFNIATALVALASFSSDLIGILPESWADTVNAVLVVSGVVGNTLLRIVTNKGLSKR